MRLWLDDTREAPAGWIHAKTAQEAIGYLKTGRVEDASLDHDLGHKTEDGAYLTRWMAENNIWPKNKPIVHSMNPYGRGYMIAMINKYGPYQRQPGE